MPHRSWAYTSHIIDTRGLVGRGKVDAAEVDGVLARFGGEGWELVAIVPIGDGAVGTASLLLTFKRPNGEH